MFIFLVFCVVLLFCMSSFCVLCPMCWLLMFNIEKCVGSVLLNLYFVCSILSTKVYLSLFFRTLYCLSFDLRLLPIPCDIFKLSTHLRNPILITSILIICWWYEQISTGTTILDTKKYLRIVFINCDVFQLLLYNKGFLFDLW